MDGEFGLPPFFFAILAPPEFVLPHGPSSLLFSLGEELRLVRDPFPLYLPTLGQQQFFLLSTRVSF